MSEAARIAAFLDEPALAAALSALNGGGEETRVVGGAVRNLLLGTDVSDVDLATTALPAETMRRAKAAGFQPVPTGLAHGTVTLVGHGASFETTTLRRDIATDGRHAVVAFGRSFAEDAQRRDFTINALSLSAGGTVHDTVGGRDDLAARRVRFIGEAGARIAEDYLRILRFFRFHAQYGRGEPDGEGRDACIAGQAGLGGLSRERVRAELMKLLVAPGAAQTVAAMAGAGLLLPVLGGVPRLARFGAVASEPAGDVYPAFRLAGLAVVVREDALRLREGLRLSNEEFDRIWRLALAQEALGGGAEPASLVQARLLAVEVGTDAVAGALVLLMACAAESLQAAAREVIAGLGRTPRFLPTGQDVLRLGVPPGRTVGRVLAAARRAWIEAGCPAGEAEQGALVAAASGQVGAPRFLN